MPKTQPPAVPTVQFAWTVEETAHGLRVRWQSVRDSLHHPESFEVVASGEGVRLCGHSPALDESAGSKLARILGAATAAVEMIRDKMPVHIIRQCIEAAHDVEALKFECKSAFPQTPELEMVA